MSDIVERLRDSLKPHPATLLRNADLAEAAGEIERLRAQILDGRRLLWLIVKSNDGYTLERAEIESYPGDDTAIIARTTDTATGDMTLSAITNGENRERNLGPIHEACDRKIKTPVYASRER